MQSLPRASLTAAVEPIYTPTSATPVDLTHGGRTIKLDSVCEDWIEVGIANPWCLTYVGCARVCVCVCVVFCGNLRSHTNVLYTK